MKPESNTGPVAWMAGNPVAANLLMGLFLVGGIISILFIVKKEFFPEISRDTVTVKVVYPGASPEEIEKGIVLSIEESIRAVDGVKEIRSTAAEGYASVVTELHSNIDQPKAYQDIKSEVDRITTFPEGAERPVVTLDVFRREVMSIAIYGDADRRSLFNLAEMLRDHFLADPEISQIDLSGTSDLEISVEVPVENLRRYGLTIPEVASLISSTSVEIPAGSIKTTSREILVRMMERREYGDEFGNIPVVTGPEGSRVLLRDIAVISDGFEDTDRFAWFDGKPAVMLNVYRVGNETPISVSDAVKKMIGEIHDTLPEGISMKVLDDRADTYRQRMSLLARNGILGIILVILLLGAFLEMRLAFWVMMGIPVSFLAAAMIMPALGLSLNMMTMFAFIVALGIVVDDAIVVGENIYHRHQEGMSFMDAAVSGTREVTIPVSFSILTNIAAFIPLALLPGTTGKILWMLPMIVISAFTFSWIESVFILPAHLAHVSEKPRRGFVNKFLHERQQKFSRWFVSSVKKYYGPFIRTALAHRYFVIAVAVSLLALTLAYVQSGRMGFEIFPQVESDYAFAFARLPYGTAVANTEEVTRKLVGAAMEVVAESGRPELSEGIFADIGKSGGHTTEIRVFLASPEIRGKIMSTQQFVDRWRDKVGRIPGVEALSFLSDRGGPGGGASLDVELRHRDMEVLRNASAELAANLGTIARVFDVEDGFQPGKEQLDFTITPEGQSLGLTSSEVARRLRGFYEGTEALRQQRGRNEIKVKVRLPREQRGS
ncbi:MAG: efflux RND transporter permease subunit, partial [Victivallales bacterium]|nr:efflux RND transporter permease subunit [Victivallales bacterium]